MILIGGLFSHKNQQRKERENMKKKLAMLLMVAVVLSSVACGKDEPVNVEEKAPAAESTGPEEEAPAAENVEAEEAGAEKEAPEPFKIAYIDSAPGDSSQQAMYDGAAAVVKAAGGEMIMVEAGHDADALVTGVEDAISAGADGLMFTPPADSVLPTVTKLCEEAGVYFAITFRSIQDEQVKEIVEACPYYAGNTYEQEYDGGYYVTELLAKSGVKQLAFISLNKGDNTADAREAGMKKACEENGIEIIGELRAPAQPSVATEALESWIATYPDLDGFALVSCQTAGVFEAVATTIETNGKAGQIKFGSCDFSNDMVSGFESNVLTALCGGHAIADRTFCAVILTNAVMGTPLSDKPVSVLVPFLYVDKAEDAQAYQDYMLGGTPFYTEEECRELLLGYYNEGLDLDRVQEIASGFSIEDVRTRHSN